MEINEIFKKYTEGEIPLEELNEALKELGVAMYHLDPEKNTIHPGEEEQFGLLDTGTGSLDKVKVVKSEYGFRVAEPVFDPETFNDGPLPVAFVKYAGELYRIDDDGLTMNDI